MISLDQIHNAKILIIDDQKLHALFLQKILDQEGYHHTQCHFDPMTAFNAILAYKPDLVVLDLIMPRIDGFQILEQLSESRQEVYLPVLALCTEKGSDMRLKALQSGATDYILKPYENVEILFRIRNMIEVRILHMHVKDQNVLLESKVEERTRELKDSQLDIIRRLAQAAEFRDNDTGLHIVRMSQYCAKFGEVLGLNDKQCELLLNASPLHDVGKIGIPDNILLKPGPLTAEEYEIMKTHTTIGSQLLSGSPSAVMKMAQTIALTHHEKWDGNGYPKRLKGSDIPLVGQICSVCDVFDALTSHRPYKKAWTTQEAIDEMVRQKDKQFVAHLVERFIDILPEIDAIRKRHAE